jgi:hypothetical protein
VFAGTPGGAEVWESFDVHVDQVIESADYLVAQLTNKDRSIVTRGI